LISPKNPRISGKLEGAGSASRFEVQVSVMLFLSAVRAITDGAEGPAEESRFAARLPVNLNLDFASLTMDDVDFHTTMIRSTGKESVVYQFEKS
jgi:hypothetical protein